MLGRRVDQGGPFESLLTPETAYLRAQARGVDTEMADLERLGGAAIQESREDMRRRWAALLNTLGEYGGSSTDFAALLSEVEAEQKAQEGAVSQDVMTQQAQAQRMKRQIAQIVPIRKSQEMFNVAMDVADIGQSYIDEGKELFGSVAGLATGNPELGAALNGGVLNTGDPGGEEAEQDEGRFGRLKIPGPEYDKFLDPDYLDEEDPEKRPFPAELRPWIERYYRNQRGQNQSRGRW